MDAGNRQPWNAILVPCVEIMVDKIYVDAMVAEMNLSYQQVLARAINLAGALAMAQAEVARLQALVPVEPSKETQQ